MYAYKHDKSLDLKKSCRFEVEILSRNSVSDVNMKDNVVKQVHLR